METDFTYDDKQLHELYGQLQPRARRQALKGAFRRAGNKLKKAVVDDIRGKVRSNRELEKGVRVLVFKQKIGFRVTLGENNKKGQGFYASRKKNRQSRAVPVLRFLDEGTNERYSRRTLYYGGKKRKRRLAPTGAPRRGRLESRGFIASVRGSLGGSMTEELANELREQTIKTAKKYGCI